jgi:NADH-quinone oxidoreductase subunit C
LSPDESAEALRERFPNDILDVTRFRGEVTTVVRRESIAQVAHTCRDLGYNFLSDLTASDWPDRPPRFDVVYHLVAVPSGVRLRLKVQAGENDTVPTVSQVWGAANWAEREVYDMFGVVFEGHPDMRRILMPEGWIGHPLRKDFQQTQIALPRPKTDKVRE